MFHTGERQLGLERRDPMRKRQGLRLEARVKRQGLVLIQRRREARQQKQGQAGRPRPYSQLKNVMK